MSISILFLVFLSLSSSLHAAREGIEVFFNHKQTTSYTDPYYRRSRPGHDLEKVALEALQIAQKTIDMAAYDFDLPLLAEALVAKARSGVRVRVILDNTNSSAFRQLTSAEILALGEHERGKYLENLAFIDANRDGLASADEISGRDSVSILRRGGVSFIDDTADGSKGSGLMHHKFIVVDGSYTVTGTANFTRSCVHGDLLKPTSRGNANSMLRISSQALARLFTQEFEEMWTGKRFGLKKSFRGVQSVSIAGIPVGVQFSPTSKTRGFEASTNGFIAREISKARKSANLALFVFSEQALVDSLYGAALQGAVPNVLIDPSFATRYYSELLDLWGLAMLDPKCRFEEGNRPWSPALRNSGFSDLDEGDVLHHKFGVLDSQEVLVGSHNWSEVANHLNDEALVAIAHPGVAGVFEEEFRYLYQRSVIGPQPWLLKKIKEAAQLCGQRN